MNNDPDGQYEEAFRQVLAHRTMLKAYVQVIVRDPVLAEDIFSEVTIAIVRVWKRFDQTRSFEKWARGVARLVALTELRKRGREPVVLDEATLEGIGGDLDACGDEVELGARKEALQQCLEKLSPANRELIRLRYFEDQSYADIARLSGRTVGALYAALSRLHTVLLECVRHNLRRA